MVLVKTPWDIENDRWAKTVKSGHLEQNELGDQKEDGRMMLSRQEECPGGQEQRIDLNGCWRANRPDDEADDDGYDDDDDDDDNDTYHAIAIALHINGDLQYHQKVYITVYIIYLSVYNTHTDRRYTENITLFCFAFQPYNLNPKIAPYITLTVDTLYRALAVVS